MTRREFVALTAAAAAARADAAPSANEFSGVPQSSRLRMHWWVFGTAWTKEEAARQLELMAAQHIGSVLIFPAHPYEVDDAARGIHNQQYLSTEFFDVLNSVVRRARELNLILDIVAGTGWPYGGPMITPELSARMLVRVPVAKGASAPALKPGETLVATFPSPDGAALLFYSAPTGQQVKRASAGAEGHVLDHYDRGAVTQYMDSVGSVLLNGVPKGSFRSFFCDSFEVYRANWTPRFPEKFQARRGYDIIEHLPALFDDAHPEARDLRYDFWRTLSELTTQEFVRPLQEWCRAHGIQNQVEAYGAPPIALDGYQYVDFPCGEGFNWKLMASSRWTSSGAHLAGRRVIGTEGWTWLGYPNRFGDSMERLKVASDLQFLCGINETYGVSYGYSPVALGAPGWPPYFGPIVNHTQPYWPHFSHLADYIARTQYVLQQGRPVTDIAVYLAEEDCFADAEVAQLLFRFNKQMSTGGRDSGDRFRYALDHGADVITTIVCNGYSFDAVDASIYRAGLRVEQGRLRLGDGDYAVLVLPNLIGIDVDVLENIARFVESGGLVIATRRLPETAYGLRDRANKQQRVKDLVARLFGFTGRKHSLETNSFGRGKAIFCPDERATLLAALRSTLDPDMQVADPNSYLGFQHRKLPDRDSYFIANTSETHQEVDAVFRVGSKFPEIWDPRTGEMMRPARWQHTPKGTRVRVALESYESKFVMLSATPSTAPIEKPRIEENGPGGIRDLPAPMTLDLEWTLSRAGSKTTIRPLRSWTELADWRAFSGSAVYEGEFTLHERFTKFAIMLDLGRIHETAEVFVNGKPAGLAWMRPYRLDVSHLLRPGRNQLRIAVTNLLINKVLADGPIDYSKVIAKYGDRFPAGDEWDLVREPFPSGLLGPVRLVFFRTISGQGSDGTSRP
jgi:hypothetical protein